MLGCAGSPWTVATYMVAGQGSRDQHETRFACADPAVFARVIDPKAHIVDALKARHPATPVVDLHKGAGGKLDDYAAGVGPNAIGLKKRCRPKGNIAARAWTARARQFRPLALIARGRDAGHCGRPRAGRL